MRETETEREREEEGRNRQTGRGWGVWGRGARNVPANLCENEIYKEQERVRTAIGLCARLVR